MKNATNRLLDRVAAKIGKTSDYALAKAFDAPQQRISNYRHERTQMDDAVAVQAANLLGEDPALILAELHADRCKSMEARKHWYRIAKMLKAEAGQRAAA
ncbi:hypothetical protein C3942_21855 [Solimonas fluminis]|uniref:Uncharacterized protein n=1 Tax=Solimonas fluminis TaxID=2086571 RepID=A0A2S5TA09_9GAMM|nr:hypothetical protein [Solimonas fluminis]PPE71776.1 hypothetical protein C3942_21855 [Solimonas fluminis]